MFEDIFDRNWELALLVHAQYEAASCLDGRLFHARARRIEELLENARHELPNWQPSFQNDFVLADNLSLN